MEMEVVGANGVRQVITTTGTFYNGPTHRHSWITMRTDLFEPNTTTPVHSDVQSINHVSKKRVRSCSSSSLDWIAISMPVSPAEVGP